MRYPLDPTPYLRDPRSAAIDSNTPDGNYVYVRDLLGTILVVPDGPHLHPKILGGRLPVLYAGDLTIKDGVIVDLTNLSGTFQFDEEQGLRDVAEQIRQQGIILQIGAVRFFPSDGSRPIILE